MYSMRLRKWQIIVEFRQNTPICKAITDVWTVNIPIWHIKKFPCILNLGKILSRIVFLLFCHKTQWPKRIFFSYAKDKSLWLSSGIQTEFWASFITLCTNSWIAQRSIYTRKYCKFGKKKKSLYLLMVQSMNLQISRITNVDLNWSPSNNITDELHQFYKPI